MAGAKMRGCLRANPAEVGERYAYRDGTVWLGRSASEDMVPVGYADDRHVCVVSGSRGGKGASSIVNNLILWPGSICVVDPKGENATVTAARRGGGSPHCKGLGQAVRVLDPFKAAQVDDSLRGRFNPLDALDPANECKFACNNDPLRGVFASNSDPL
jgi:type IV secretory pathway TraG/TraD family ATPase VirD4